LTKHEIIYVTSEWLRRPALKALVTPCGVLPSKSGGLQADRVTLTNTCRCYNSSSDNFTDDLRLAGVPKRFAGGLKSFAHHGNHLRFEEHSGIVRGTNWHDHYLSHRRLPCAIVLASVLRVDVAVTKSEGIKAGGKKIEVVRITITDISRREFGA
jgi:hypothetical protein